MTIASHLLLLPADATGAATLLQVDGNGRVLARDTVTGTAPAATAAAEPPPRQVLAVPGADCLVLWLALPARNPAQALAAARLLVEDHVAGARDSLHIAIGPLVPGTEKRLLVALESAQMQDWLDRAAALGMTPDVVVPIPLLLPAVSRDDAPDAVAVVEYGDHWLVRGEQLAFAAEPALATQILGTRQRVFLPDAEAALATGSTTPPPVNLLQYRFAPAPSRREGWPAYRRAAVLAGLLALSPLLLLGAQALRLELDARALEARASQQARTLLPSLADNADPLPPIRERLAELRSADVFARTTAALLAAVGSVEGSELDALTYADGELQAIVVHGGAADLERIRASLADAGLELVETGSHADNGRTRSSISVRPAA